MLTMNHVAYSYHKAREAVQIFEDKTLSFEQGTMYGIFGPSGSGKTTCLALLGGLERPDKGEILLDGVSIAKISRGICGSTIFPMCFRTTSCFPI